MKNKYKITKSKLNQNLEIDFSKMSGLLIKPKNKINYDGVIVTKLLLINNKFIEVVLKKKIKNKLNIYLNYIIEFIENDSSDDNTRIALSDIEKYKATIINRYALYLDKKYISILIKKIELIEKELLKKLAISQKKKEMASKLSALEEEKVSKTR